MPAYPPAARQSFTKMVTDPAQQLANHAAALRSSYPALATGGTQILSWGRISEAGAILSSSGDFEVEKTGTGKYVIYWCKSGSVGAVPPQRVLKPNSNQIIQLTIVGEPIAYADSIRVGEIQAQGEQAQGFTVEAFSVGDVPTERKSTGFHMLVLSAGAPGLPEPPA
jgi:hypothetical protein